MKSPAEFIPPWSKIHYPVIKIQLDMSSSWKTTAVWFKKFWRKTLLYLVKLYFPFFQEKFHTYIRLLNIPKIVIQLVSISKFTEVCQIWSNLDDLQSFYVDFCTFATFNIWDPAIVHLSLTKFFRGITAFQRKIAFFVSDRMLLF